MERQPLRKKFNKMIPMPNNTVIRKAKEPKRNNTMDNETTQLEKILLHKILTRRMVGRGRINRPAAKRTRITPEFMRNRDKILKELMTSKLKRKKQLSHK